ncbi:hypothetical protein VKT23_015476 [Stygiomarasmius scandens]|uniref:NAD(P)-binding protein n=1 Tax=Marasmiellus scandens TaxID=2682957 RepID=A0ABR1J033_9AGAR
MPLTLSGGNVFLTGAASGIGQAIAIRYAKAGADGVYGCDQNPMDETEKQCKQAATNPNFRFIQHIMDVRKEDQVIASVEKCMKEFGRLDYAANVAGIADSDVSTAEQKMDEWDNVMNINTRGVYICMREEIKAMLKNSPKEIAPGRSTRGSIINMGSVGGLVVLPGIRTSYVTAKHAIAGMTKAAAVSHGKEGVRVNAINPGYIATPMVKNAYEDLTPFGQPVAMKVIMASRRIGI